MAFQLVIAEGKESGREFVFTQDSVTIGRTPECDVILYEPGVSRQHARIFAERGAFFVEDLGSSNGTKVNGSTVQKHELSEGDTISLGPVVFKFSAPAGLSPEPTTDADLAPAQSTRIVQESSLARKPRAALAPVDDEGDPLQALARARTTSMPSVSRPPLSERLPVLRGRKSESPARVDRAVTDPEGSSGAEAISAAERARIRREHSALGARVRLFWLESTAATRRSVIAAATVLTAGLFGGGLYLAMAPAENASLLPPEPSKLSRSPIEASFGLGPGVSYERTDLKTFEFDFIAPVQAVVILHYQSKDISQGEVVVSCNGTDVGNVPPDSLAVSERSNEIIIPPQQLKKGIKNKLVFDNTHNPPQSDPWRIWNVWIEINLLPELDPTQLLSDANASFQRGQVNFERRDVGARNRYEAWRAFRAAWLMLEAHPDPKPELYQFARDKVKEAQLELDRTCAKLMLEAEGYYNQNKFDNARSTLEHVKEYFPANDQPCPWRADAKKQDYGL